MSRKQIFEGKCALENPNPKKYVIRFRKGEPVLVDRQIDRWRKFRKPDTFASYYKRKPKPTLGEELIAAAVPVKADEAQEEDNLGLNALLERDV